MEFVSKIIRGYGFTKPPNGGWGWAVVLGSFIVHFNCLGLQFTFGILFKALLDDEEFQKASGNVGSTSASTWAGSIGSCLMLACSLPSGMLLQRYTMRQVALTGAVLMCAGLVLGSQVSQLLYLYLTYGGITGVGFGLMWSTSIVAVGKYFTTKLPTATGLAVAGSGVGTLVFSSISAHLIQQIGWRATLQVFAVLTGVSNVAAALLFLPISPPAVVQESASSASIRISAMDGRGRLDDVGPVERGGEEEQEDGGRGDVGGGQDMVACAPEKGKKDVEHTVLTVRELLRHRAAMPLGLFMTIYAGMLWVPYTFLVTYSRTVGGLSPAASGRLVAGMTWLAARSNGMQLHASCRTCPRWTLL